MIAIPGWYEPEGAELLRKQAEEARAKVRRDRKFRVKDLQRKIQVAKRRRQEYDHLLAELRVLMRDEAKDLEEALASARRTR